AAQRLRELGPGGCPEALVKDLPDVGTSRVEAAFFEDFLIQQGLFHLLPPDEVQHGQVWIRQSTKDAEGGTNVLTHYPVRGLSPDGPSGVLQNLAARLAVATQRVQRRQPRRLLPPRLRLQLPQAHLAEPHLLHRRPAHFQAELPA